MPSSGKSTIAKALAECLGYTYMDLDHMVEEREGMSLIEVMHQNGAQYFRDMEYQFLQDIPSDTSVVIATPGSAIYHEPMMRWLQEHTYIICIEEDISVIEERLAHTPKAISDLKEKGLQRLWEERMPVYKKWAHVIVETNQRGVEEIVEECVQYIKK
jgi:shikimate kinase